MDTESCLSSKVTDRLLIEHLSLPLIFFERCLVSLVIFPCTLYTSVLDDLDAM